MALKIETGRYYRTRDGRKVGPMQPNTKRDPGYYGQWEAPREAWMDFSPIWHQCGHFWPGKETDRDLIAEWTDEPLPHGHARLPSGEVIDLTAIEKPFGLLPADVQQAMKDHGGPWECWQSNGNWEAINPGWGISQTYRVRPLPPEPKRETVKRSLHGEAFMGYVAIDLVDGEPDWSTIRKWEAL